MPKIVTGQKGPKAKEQPEQDVTITATKIVKSPRFTEKRKDGTVVPRQELAVTMRPDNGPTFTEYLGGVYPNDDGTVGFGAGGKALEFIKRWAQATNRDPQDIGDLVGSRVHVAVIAEQRGSFYSQRVMPVGPARTAAPLNAPPTQPQPQQTAPNLGALAALAKPAAPAVIDGKALFDAIADASAKAGIVQAAKQMSEAELAQTLRSVGVGTPAGHAEAIAAHAKGL